MFDVGISELGVIGVVALVVIGPEQLPRVARTAGHVMGKLRRYVSDVKSDINREMELADLKNMQEEVKSSAQAFEHSMREQVGEIASDLEATTTEHSIAPPESVSLSEQPVAEAVAQAPVAVPPASEAIAESTPETPPVDENQLDLFGVPIAPIAAAEKH